jgi:CSLREA domain-containing protein
LTPIVNRSRRFFPANAAVFVVSSIGDDGDESPGEGICATAQGTCTLRAALEEANATANGGGVADEIHFSLLDGSTILPRGPLPRIAGRGSR